MSDHRSLNLNSNEETSPQTVLRNIQIEEYSFSGPKPGPHLVICARIHGDEPSGERAARLIIDELAFGKIKLDAGRVTIFPVANPLAKHRGVRYVDVDANRDIGDSAGLIDFVSLVQDYPAADCEVLNYVPEQIIRSALGRRLQAISQQALNGDAQPWHFLDLHSVATPGEAHVIVSDEADDLAAAENVGLRRIYSGWRESRLKLEQEDLSALKLDEQGNERFCNAAIYAAKAAGAQTSICVEAGQHTDGRSILTAYDAIRSALSFHGISEDYDRPVRASFTKVAFQQVLIKRDDSEHLIGINQGGQVLKPGQLILRGGSREIRVPDTVPDNHVWVIAHPKLDAPTGHHLGYLSLEQRSFV